MPSKMLLEVDRKLRNLEPLTDEEALWLRKRIDKGKKELANLRPGEIITMTPVDNENDDWVTIRYLPPKKRD